MLYRYPIGLAWTSRMVNPRAAANNDFFFQKIFGDGEYIAAGQLMIPPQGHKPSKMTKDNTYVHIQSICLTILSLTCTTPGVLCHRRRSDIQSARILLHPLHRRHDPRPARKYLLHREHLRTRRASFLRASSSRQRRGRATAQRTTRTTYTVIARCGAALE